MEEILLPEVTRRPDRSADVILTEHRLALDLTRREMTVALERRRRELERALHDGAQQQLLALRMEILRVVDASSVDDSAWGVAIAGVVARLDAALDDLGRLASGQLPRALDVDNLVDSLRQLAAISGAAADVQVPASLIVDEATVEVVAFVVSEALANAQQHSNSSRCTVTVVQTLDGLRVDVNDDGRGGATIVPGRGIDGLRQRAEALGGTLELFSDDAGTLLRLHLPQPSAASRLRTPPSHEADEADGAIGAVTRKVRAMLGDATADLWFWCAPSLPGTNNLDASWRSETGHVIDGGVVSSYERSLVHTSNGPKVRLVRLRAGDQLLALLATDADTDRVASVCRSHLGAIVEGRERALASPAIERLRSEHSRIARRSQSFEDALRRRLTDRPREELLTARGCLTGHDRSRRTHAAEHVANATELLREIVRRLRVPDGDWASASTNLTTTLQRIARRARVRVDLDADDLDDETASTVVERVAEEVMLDAPPRTDLIVRVRAHGHHATLSVSLQRLPSPVAIALLEELSLASGSTVTFRPNLTGVRLLLEVPCGL